MRKNNMHNATIGEIITALLALIVVALFFIIVVTSLDKSEVVSCLELEAQAQEYGGFYLTQWQVEMCEAHNITINAPVK